MAGAEGGRWERTHPEGRPFDGTSLRLTRRMKMQQQVQTPGSSQPPREERSPAPRRLEARLRQQPAPPASERRGGRDETSSYWRTTASEDFSFLSAAVGQRTFSVGENGNKSRWTCAVSPGPPTFMSSRQLRAAPADGGLTAEPFPGPTGTVRTGTPSRHAALTLGGVREAAAHPRATPTRVQPWAGPVEGCGHTARCGR